MAKKDRQMSSQTLGDISAEPRHDVETRPKGKDKGEKPQPVTFLMPPEFHHQLKGYAYEHKTSLQAILEAAINMFCESKSMPGFPGKSEKLKGSAQ